MKRVLIAVLSNILLLSCNAAEIDQLYKSVVDVMPAGWSVSITTNKSEYKPLEQLDSALAQLTIVSDKKSLSRETREEKVFFSPNIILFVFDITKQNDIERGVRAGRFSSKYPPVNFGHNKSYIFITSPGYQNNGIYSPEGKAALREIKFLLSKIMEVN